MLGRTMRIAWVLLLLLPVTAQAETQLESLVWEDGVLILGFDGPYESRSMVLDDPHRIVMDFPEVQSKLSRHVYGGSGPLETIRVGQNEAHEPGGRRVRVVLDLASTQNFLSEQAGNYLRIVLSSGSGEDLGMQAAEGLQSTTDPVFENAPVEEFAAVEYAAAEPLIEEEASELPMIAASDRLPAPPPVEETPAKIEVEESMPPMMAANSSAMNPMAALPVARTEELPAPDLNREDPAPVGWEDSVNAEFNRLFAEQAEPVASASAMLPMAGPLDDMSMAALPETNEIEAPVEAVGEPTPAPDYASVPEPTEVEPAAVLAESSVDSPVINVQWAEPESAETQDTERAAIETEAVFFGDPFEVVEESPAAQPTHVVEPAELAETNTESADLVVESTPVVKVEARLPETDHSESRQAAAPVGKPVVMGASMGATPGWEVSVSASPEPTFESNVVEQSAPPVAPVETNVTSAPVVKFTRHAEVGESSAKYEEAVMQVASAEAPAKAAPRDKQSDRERSMRLAMMAGHERVKPDEATISLEMRGAEFSTLLRAFSEFAGMNIIAGREVKGKVSVNLKEVPWREALSAVCSAHGYSVKEEHGLLRVAPLSSLLKEEMEMLTAQKKRSEYRPLHTEVVKLSYAVAGELVTPLSRMLGERGKMDIDSRTNSLLITDLPEAVEQMVALARNLDHQIPQVEITARIVDVDYAASRDLGIKWEALNLVNSSAGLVGSGGVDGTFPAPVGEFKMAKVHDWGEINVTLQAMEKENKANIISNPRVMTMDNREASILVGKKIPLIVADEAGNAVTQLTTIGIKLVVTPHINPDGRIMMDVLTEVSDLASEATVQGGVIITTSESKTNVMVDNAETAVIAGLLKASDSELDSEVPFFGRIPILGKLFGYNNKSESKRELVIFITPRVIHPGGETTAADLTEEGFSIPLDG